MPAVASGALLPPRLVSTGAFFQSQFSDKNFLSLFADFCSTSGPVPRTRRFCVVEVGIPLIALSYAERLRSALVWFFT